MWNDDENSNQEEEVEPIPISSVLDIEEDDGEAWLMSYADLMTLVACFFILMTAFASFDTKSFSRVAKEVKEYFRGANVQDIEDDMTELISKLDAITQNREVINIRSMDNGIEIKFNSEYFYEPAKAVLKPDMESLLTVMVEVIKDTGEEYIIEAHGHTDSRPLKGGRFKNNWELSAARAISVVKLFSKLGYQENYLVASGYGATRPEVKETDANGKLIAQNMSRNRRVILLVKKPSEEFLLGLGKIYRKEAKQNQ